jgi:hypothetical protein
VSALGIGRGFSRSGSAWLGRSQKDGLPSCRGGYFIAVQSHQLAHRGGQPGRCPFQLGGMWVTTLILKRAPIGSNQEDYALRPHLARIFFIAFASLAASCSSERAQKEAAERKEIGGQLTAAYYSCVRTSFASMRPTMVDRNMGIDQAFMVCRTEESKLQAFEQSLSENPNVSNAAIAAHRNTLKEELLRQ